MYNLFFVESEIYRTHILVIWVAEYDLLGIFLSK